MPFLSPTGYEYEAFTRANPEFDMHALIICNRM